MMLHFTNFSHKKSTSDSAEFPRGIGAVLSRMLGRASPRMTKVRDMYDIGTSIIKKSNDIPYNGNVISDNGKWCKIKYEDDNEKELTHRELTKNVQQANTISLVNGWYDAYLGFVQEEPHKSQ